MGATLSPISRAAMTAFVEGRQDLFEARQIRWMVDARHGALGEPWAPWTSTISTQGNSGRRGHPCRRRTAVKDMPTERFNGCWPTPEATFTFGRFTRKSRLAMGLLDLFRKAGFGHESVRTRGSEPKGLDRRPHLATRLQHGHPMRTWLTLLATASVVTAGAGAWGWNQYVAGTWTSSTMVVQVAPDLDAAGRLDALEEAWEDTPGERVLRTWCGGVGTDASRRGNTPSTPKNPSKPRPSGW